MLPWPRALHDTDVLPEHYSVTHPPHTHTHTQPHTPQPHLPVGTNIGGGTFWGLCKLLTGMDSFNDILALSDEGDNSNVRAVTSSGRQRQGGPAAAANASAAALVVAVLAAAVA